MDTRSVSRRTRTTRLSPSAASSPSFAEDYLDIDHWPQRWRIEPGDLLPGQRLLDIFKPFLYSLLDQGLSRKTLRLHRDHVCALGGEIIRQLMLIGAIAGAEMAMLDVGIKVTPGSGVAAASEYWRSHDPIPRKRVSQEEQFYESHSTGSIQG